MFLPQSSLGILSKISAEGVEDMVSKLLSLGRRGKYVADEVPLNYKKSLYHALICQVSNIASFLKWPLGSKEAWLSSPCVASLRRITSSLCTTLRARQETKYWDADWPDFGGVAETTHVRCVQILNRDVQEPSTKESLEEVEGVLAVALQILIPPMRGKPFWSLLTHDDGIGSM